MNPVIKLALAALLVAILIFVHELGHFLMAKLLRVKVVRFSLGFGPRLVGFQRGETEYVIAALPFGGYVKMAGDDPTEPTAPEDRGRGFLEQAPWKRGAIGLAGPVASLVFPVLVYFAVFYFQTEAISARLGHVDPDLPAWSAGLRPGDRIVSVDGVPVRHFAELRDLVGEHWDRSLAIAFEREGKVLTTSITPKRIEERNPIETQVRGIIGVAPFASAAVIGVPGPESPAARAGLQTFDRVVKLNGQPIERLVELTEGLAAASGPVEVVALRSVPASDDAPISQYETVTARIERGPGDGAAAYGIEGAELYLYAVRPGTPAEQAGLRRGDRLVSLNGERMSTWLTFERTRERLADEPLSVGFLRDGELQEVVLRQERREHVDEYGTVTPLVIFGAQRDTRPTSYVDGERIAIDPTAGESMLQALKVVPDAIRTTALVIFQLIFGPLSMKSISSPVGIVDIAAKSAEAGWDRYLEVMALISVNLGVMNLLPIPVLDGFHILSAFWETVRRRPLSVRARVVANYIGIFVLLSLMFLAIKNDVVRLLQ